MTVPSAPKPKRRGHAIAAGVVFIIVAGVIVVICSGVITSMSNQKPDPKIEATVACEDFVKTALKAPSTANFDNETATGPVAGHPARYIVVGTVDAQNSFGAQLRNNFGCTAEKQGDGQWHLIDMTGLN